jgi:hypothetical protein
MLTGWEHRIKLLSLGMVAATALVVAAWPEAAKADGEEVYYVEINAQYSNRLGDYCHAYANVYNGTPNYYFVWESDYLWNGTRTGNMPEIRSAYLNEPSTEESLHIQVLKVTDHNMNYDEDEMGVWVHEEGDECLFAP